MERLPLDCPDEAILAVARRWTERLAAEDYAGAWEMLLHRPGEVWAPSPEVLRARVANYGSREPIPGEPVCRVTPIESASGKPWRTLPSLTREPRGNPHRYPAYRGRLDWELPLNGEWSDLVASFDLVEDGGELAFVLASLRVPKPGRRRRARRWTHLGSRCSPRRPCPDNSSAWPSWSHGWG